MIRGGKLRKEKVISTEMKRRNATNKRGLTFNEWVEYYHLKKMEYEFTLQHRMQDEFNLKQSDISKILENQVKFRRQ